MGCVYFIKHNKASPVKIGYTSAAFPTKRVEAAETYAPYGIDLIGWFVHSNANKIEKVLHTKYAPFRLAGEWFNITREQAEAIIYSYDNKQLDRGQRALLRYEDKDFMIGDELKYIKDNLWGQEMNYTALVKQVTKLFTAGDYPAAKVWIEKHLTGLSWYQKYRPETSGRGRPGVRVRIGAIE